MSGFWKNLFARDPAPSSKPDETYELEWRNRYLEARLTNLTKKLQKAGKFLPPSPKLPSDLNARNEVLAETVKAFEAALKQ